MKRLKLGEGQMLQAIKALPAKLRAQAATAPEALGTPSAVRAQTAAIKSVGIPSDWHEDGKVKVSAPTDPETTPTAQSGSAIQVATCRPPRVTTEGMSGL